MSTTPKKAAKPASTPSRRKISGLTREQIVEAVRSRLAQRSAPEAEPHPVLGTPCYIWRGRFSNPVESRGRGGTRDPYGRVFLNWEETEAVLGHPKKRRCSEYAAHKVAYAAAYGPVPDGYHVDHACHVRACVNPAHLRLLTSSENSTEALHWRYHGAGSMLPLPREPGEDDAGGAEGSSLDVDVDAVGPSTDAGGAGGADDGGYDDEVPF